MAYSPQDWMVVRAFYERGLSLAEIVAREEVSIKDRGSISRKAKQEGWTKGEKATLLQKEIETKQKVAEIAEKKATLNATELQVHNTLVAEKLKAVEVFHNLNMKVASTLAKKLESDGELASYQDLNAAATAITKAQENILGKQPDTVINNTNAMQANSVVNLPADEIRRINQALEDAC